MPHISVRKLAVSYGSHQALKEMSVDIPDGQITAVIGPSGCGKSTFLKSLNRLVDLYDEISVSGEVFIDEVNIYDPRADVLALRKKVGFLSQRPFALPMSIYDNIAYGPRIHRMKGRQLVEQIQQLHRSILLQNGEDPGQKLATPEEGEKGAMDFVVEYYLKLSGLWEEVKDRLHEPASRLSIGQQQRLALARALAIEPRVILADEPTSALDPLSAQLVERQFQLLKKDYTIVVVTHILRQARRIADYVIFLYLGELVEHGPAKRVFSSPRDPRTRAYITGEIS
jgi:phosphate transport system ATP-binding protein